MLWFIRSRSYVSVADVRRRFEEDLSDDVTGIDGPDGRVYIGLPQSQARLLQELWVDGRIGFELAPDIHALSVAGVYGMFARNEFQPILQKEELSAESLEPNQFAKNIAPPNRPTERPRERRPLRRSASEIVSKMAI